MCEEDAARIGEEERLRSIVGVPIGSWRESSVVVACQGGAFSAALDHLGQVLASFEPHGAYALACIDGRLNEAVPVIAYVRRSPFTTQAEADFAEERLLALREGLPGEACEESCRQGERAQPEAVFTYDAQERAPRSLRTLPPSAVRRCGHASLTAAEHEWPGGVETASAPRSAVRTGSPATPSNTRRRSSTSSRTPAPSTSLG